MQRSLTLGIETSRLALIWINKVLLGVNVSASQVKYECTNSYQEVRYLGSNQYGKRCGVIVI